MNSKSKLHPDLVIAIASLLFGGLLLMTIRSYPEEVKLFPQIFLLLFIVFMAIILVQGVKKTLHPENYDSSEWWCTKETVQNPAISGALIIVYVVLLGIVGFYIATACYMLVTMFIFGARNLKVNILITAIMLAFCYILFQRALSVTLPEGLLLKSLIG